MRHVRSGRLIGTGLTMATALLLMACSGKSSTDTVDDSQLTQMNGVGTIEGTVNDAAAMDGPMNSATSAEPIDNAAEAQADKTADNAAGKADVTTNATKSTKP